MASDTLPVLSRSAFPHILDSALRRQIQRVQQLVAAHRKTVPFIVEDAVRYSPAHAAILRAIVHLNFSEPEKARDVLMEALAGKLENLTKWQQPRRDR